MRAIYLLKSTSHNSGLFIQTYSSGEESIIGRAMDEPWRPFGSEYQPIVLSLAANDTGKKNYQFDFCAFLNPFLIFSELALEELDDILKLRGQILPVITESKKKIFFGYYPTNALSGCLDKENSVYREYPNGLMIEKPVLIADNISDEYLFSIEEDISRVFVTDKFKQRVEEAGLSGFDFSVEIPTS